MGLRGVAADLSLSTERKTSVAGRDEGTAVCFGSRVQPPVRRQLRVLFLLRVSIKLVLISGLGGAVRGKTFLDVNEELILNRCPLKRHQTLDIKLGLTVDSVSKFEKHDNR